MDSFEQLLKNQAKLIAAFNSIELSPKEKSDLGVLFHCADGVAITRDKGKRARGETIYSCSRIGSRLGAYFKEVRPRDKMMWLGTIEPHADDLEKWIIRPEIKKTVESLGWF